MDAAMSNDPQADIYIGSSALQGPGNKRWLACVAATS